MSESISIKVSVKPNYLQEQSDPKNKKFVWSYEVTIINDSEEMIQLLNRFWRITDMTGRVEEVYGTGVIGLQPLIKPGKQFIYTSFCQLTAPQGTMEGHYEIQNLEEKGFQITIPKIILSANVPTELTKTYRAKLH